MKQLQKIFAHCSLSPGRRMLCMALVFFIVGCQSTLTDPVSVRDQAFDDSSLRGDIPLPHPLSGFERRIIFLRGADGTSVEILAEIADEPQKHARGLMERTSLGDREGMLFIFAKTEPVSFWMKHTLIPLDILYFDADGKWVSGSTMTPCVSDPCSLYPSHAPARFALEVPSGFMESVGVGSGWTLERKQ